MIVNERTAHGLPHQNAGPSDGGYRGDCGGFSPGSGMAVATSATLCPGRATGFGGPVDSMGMNYDERVSPRLLKRLTK